MARGVKKQAFDPKRLEPTTEKLVTIADCKRELNRISRAVLDRCLSEGYIENEIKAVVRKMLHSFVIHALGFDPEKDRWSSYESYRLRNTGTGLNAVRALIEKAAAEAAAEDLPKVMAEARAQIFNEQSSKSKHSGCYTALEGYQNAYRDKYRTELFKKIRELAEQDAMSDLQEMLLALKVPFEDLDDAGFGSETNIPDPKL